jgi:hypothetical protein
MTAHPARPTASSLTVSPPSGSGPHAMGAGGSLLAAPFDALRFHYASAVAAGLAPRSILAAGRLERALGLLEALVLGPLARHR